MYFDLEMTKNCNLRCRYCFVHHKDAYLDAEKGKKIVDFAIKMNGVRKQKEITFNFFGGEPLLCFETIKYLTEYAQKRAQKNKMNLNFDITTNGTILNEEIKKFLIENKFNIKISLDGAQESHDLNRKNYNGTGSYSAIKGNIDQFLECQKETNIPIQISMIVNRNTHSSFFDNLKDILKQGFVFIDTGVNYYEEWTNEEYNNFEKELDRAVNFYFESLENMKMFEWSLLTNSLKMHLEKQVYQYCGAAAKCQFFNVDGKIFPCTASQKLEVGIGDVDSGYDLDNVAKFTKYKRNLDKKCSNCKINHTCSGCDCIVLNYEVNEDFRKVPNAVCQMNKIMYKIGKKVLDNDYWMSLINREKKKIVN